jgi:cytochrome c oxidase subunit 2
MLSSLLPVFPRRRLLLFFIPAVAIFISACGTGNPQDTFDTAGPVAEEQAKLFKFIFWIAVIVFILVEGGIIWITLKYRRRSDTEMPKQTHGNTKLEITWTIIPALIIIAIAIPTIRTIWDLAEPPADEPVMFVEAIGHQWWFEFRYPAEELVTANELVVPVGKNVVVKLLSQDVIHSFWVPKLFGKVDMIPTRENELWFRADKEDAFFGQCAEFCDVGHALMRFRVIAKPENEYAEWVAGMRRAPDAPAAGSAEARGQALFPSTCGTCHTTDSYRAGSYEQEITFQDLRWSGWLANIEDARIVSAPNLTHFGTRTTFAAGTRDLDRSTLIEWIEDPGSIKQETRMQEHALVYNCSVAVDSGCDPDGTANLTAEEVSDLADYLLSLVPGDETVAVEISTPAIEDPVEFGRVTFAANCILCHSTTSERLVGPGLAGVGDRAGARIPGLSADQYIEQSIREPGAFFADGLAGMPALALSDAEIAGLIAYLKTLN